MIRLVSYLKSNLNYNHFREKVAKLLALPFAPLRKKAQKSMAYLFFAMAFSQKSLDKVERSRASIQTFLFGRQIYHCGPTHHHV
jgi:hypothetical protein